MDTHQIITVRQMLMYTRQPSHAETDANVAVQVLPGSQLLASADEQGNIAVKDLRMLGGSSQHAPWPRASPTKAPPAPTRSSATAAPQPGSSHAWYHAGKLLRSVASVMHLM